MKKTIYQIIISVLFAVWFSAGVRAEQTTMFVYPSPPDTMTTLQARADYYISRFWDRCDFGYAMKNIDQFDKAFGDWLSLFPHASADTADLAVRKLLTRFSKKGPETTAIIHSAENWLYSDTAAYNAPGVYRTFLEGALASKKLSGDDRRRYTTQLKRIESSSVGQRVPDLTLTRPDGTKIKLDDIKGGSVLIFFDKPESSLDRVRLSGDFNARELSEAGQMCVVCIYPGTPSKEWLEQAALYPAYWTTGWLPDADSYFDLRRSPAIFYLDSKHRVLTDDLTLDHLLTAFRVANQARKSDE